MSLSTIGLDESLTAYLRDNGVRESPVLAALREQTASLQMARMQIAPEQGAFMQMLIRLLGARRCLEVGVFTGYSSTAIALALPPDGTLIACDINEEWAAMAQRAWQQAGVADKVQLRLAPASQTLGCLISDGQSESFDFAFIDADKESYELYYEKCLCLVRPGGLIAVDNVLWGGQVLQTAAQTDSTRAIQQFNARRRDDSRVDLSMVPIGDGVMLLRKR